MAVRRDSCRRICSQCASAHEINITAAFIRSPHEVDHAHVERRDYWNVLSALCPRFVLQIEPNQPMTATAPDRMTAGNLAAAPCRGLSLFR